MKCSFAVDKLTKFNKARCIVSEKDTDPVIGGEFIIILEPFDSWGEPMYYWSKKDDGTYEVEGEGYIITHDFDAAIRRHKERVSKTWGNIPVKWVEKKSTEVA